MCKVSHVRRLHVSTVCGALTISFLVLFQLDSAQSVTTPSFTIATESLPNTSRFSILTDDCDLAEEIQQRIKLASSAFGRLSHRVFLNNNLTIPTKVGVYNAVWISNSTTVYECEVGHFIVTTSKPWSLSISSFQRIRILRWWHNVTRTEIRRRTSCKALTDAYATATSLDWTRNPHAIQPSSSPYPVW